MTGDAEGFGERLRSYRARAGLSQEELADRSGVSVRAIGDMERGRTRWPHRDSVRLLADTLGLTDLERDGFLELARRPVDASAAGPGQVTDPHRGPSASGERDAGLIPGRGNATAGMLGEVADQLAAVVAGQWHAEAAIRRLNDPYPLPVRWVAADPALVDDWQTMVTLASSGAGWPPQRAVGGWAGRPGRGRR